MISIYKIGGLRILSGLLGGVVIILMARATSVSDFGKFQVVQTYGYFLAMIYAFGLPQVISPIFAKDFKDKKAEDIKEKLAGMLYFLVIIFLFSTAAAIAFCWLFLIGGGLEAVDVLFVVLIGIFITAQCLSGEILRAHGDDFASFILLNFIAQNLVTILVLGGAGIFIEADYIVVTASLLIGLICSVAYGLVNVFKIDTIRPLGWIFFEEFSLIKAVFHFKSYFKIVFFLFLNSFFVFFLLQGGGIIASMNLSKESSGLFFAAQKLSNQLMFVGTIVFYKLPRLLATTSIDDKEKIRKIYNQSAYQCILLVAPLVLIIILFPEELLALIFGNSYSDAGFVFAILSMAVFMNLAMGQRSVILVNSGYGSDIFKATLFSGPIAMILMYFLSQSHGAAGISVGVFLGYMIQIFMECFYVKKRVGFFPLF